MHVGQQEGNSIPKFGGNCQTRGLAVWMRRRAGGATECGVWCVRPFRHPSDAFTMVMRIPPQGKKCACVSTLPLTPLKLVLRAALFPTL